MKHVINKFLLMLPMIVVATACKPTEDNQSLNKSQQLLANNCQYKESASSLSEESPFTVDIGKIKVDEALKKCPELLKANNSFIDFAGQTIIMPESYFLSPVDGGMAIFQFDEGTKVLQNVIVMRLKKSFESAKNDLKKHYLIYPQFNLTELEAISISGMTLKNYRQYLEDHKDGSALFKQGSVLISLGKDSQNESNIVIFYQNSDYFPVLEQKVELSSKIIQLLGKQQITEDIGYITVEEALKKYPELRKANGSSITYAGKRIAMPNSYFLSLANGAMVGFQFDEKTNVLQNVLVVGLKQSFESVQEDLEKYYPIHRQYTVAEFESNYTYDNTTFENHHKILEELKDRIVLFKQGSVLITLAKDNQNEGNIVMFYQNSDYFPVMKEKAATIK